MSDLTDFPKMLYRKGGDCQGCATLLVGDRAEEARYLGEGWHPSIEAAKAAEPDKPAPPQPTQAEIDRLKADLETAGKRIAEVEAQRDQATETVAEMNAQIEALTAPKAKAKSDG